MIQIVADPSSRFVLAEDHPLPANLGVLWRTDPTLAAAIEAQLDEPAYPTEPSRAGPPTIALETPDGRTVYLHSRHNPVEEARRMVSVVAASSPLGDGAATPNISGGDAATTTGKGLYALHGLGLGYQLEALAELSADAALIIVIEPDLRLIRTALSLRDFSKKLRTGRIVFITEADRGKLLGRLTAHQHLAAVGLELVTHAPSMQLHPEFHRQIQTWLMEFAAYCRTSLQTLLLNGRRTCENLARNIGWYAAAPGLQRLRDRHKGQPAIIVSAGPSLRKNKHLLSQAAGHAVIIAVQTTLQPLLEMGIEPNYVTSLDYHEICTRFFEKLPKNLSTELIAEPKASPAVLGMYPGPITILGCDYSDKILRELKQTKDRLRAGATVAHLAFYLAEYAGCDPIIFVGQDLAFSDGLCYTPGTSYEDVWRPELGRFCTIEMKQWEQIIRERPILRKIEDWDGGPIYTEERLFTYLQQFERDFAASSRTIIDSSEGGARKRGAAPMTLVGALEQYCSAPLSAAEETDHVGLNRALHPQVQQCLKARLEESRKIMDIGRRTLPLLEEVRDHLDDAMRVNRAIAQIDRLRAEMFELNDCYELVMQLTQQSELERFRRDYDIAASKAAGIDKQRRQVERDIANVKSVIAAAGEFEKLMVEVECLQR